MRELKSSTFLVKQCHFWSRSAISAFWLVESAGYDLICSKRPVNIGEEITKLLNADGKDHQKLHDLITEYLEKDNGEVDSDVNNTEDKETSEIGGNTPQESFQYNVALSLTSKFVIKHEDGTNDGIETKFASESR